MGDSSESFSAPEDEAPREYQANDSDSDGPILYTDDDDEEDDDDDVCVCLCCVIFFMVNRVISLPHNDKLQALQWTLASSDNTVIGLQNEHSCQRQNCVLMFSDL